MRKFAIVGACNSAGSQWEAEGGASNAEAIFAKESIFRHILA